MRLLIAIIAALYFTLPVYCQVGVALTATLKVDGGDLVGASLEPSGDGVIVQQVTTTQSHRMRMISRLQTNNQGQVSTLNLGEISPAPAQICGRVYITANNEKVLLCSAYAYIDILDGHNLMPIARLGEGRSQQIFDFAVNERLNVVATLSLSANRTIDLCVYSFSSGKLLTQTSFHGDNLSSMNMASDEIRGRIAVNIARVNRLGEKSSISLCDLNGALSCSKEYWADRMNQIEFFGTDLIGAPSDTESKNDCLVKFGQNGSLENSYCAPDSGVHLVFGIVGKRYVVAFTGLTSYSKVREESSTTKSSYSIWEAERRLPTATLDDPFGIGSDQRFGRIIPSEGSNGFLLYKVHAKQLFVYKIRRVGQP